MSILCPDWDSAGECQWVTVGSVRAADPAPLSVNRLGSGLMGSRRHAADCSQRSQVQILPPLPNLGPESRVIPGLKRVGCETVVGPRTCPLTGAERGSRVALAHLLAAAGGAGRQGRGCF